MPEAPKLPKGFTPDNVEPKVPLPNPLDTEETPANGDSGWFAPNDNFGTVALGVFCVTSLDAPAPVEGLTDANEDSVGLADPNPLPCEDPRAANPDDPEAFPNPEEANDVEDVSAGLFSREGFEGWSSCDAESFVSFFGVKLGQLSYKWVRGQCSGQTSDSSAGSPSRCLFFSGSRRVDLSFAESFEATLVASLSDGPFPASS